MVQATSHQQKGIALIEPPSALLVELSDLLFRPADPVLSGEPDESDELLPSVDRYLKNALGQKTTAPVTPRQMLERLMISFHSQPGQKVLQKLERQRLALESKKLEEKKQAQKKQEGQEREQEEAIQQEEEQETQVREAQAQEQEALRLENERQQTEVEAPIYLSPTVMAFAIALTKTIDELSEEYTEVLESVEVMQLEVHEIIMSAEEVISPSAASAEWEKQAKEDLFEARISTLKAEGINITEDIKAKVKGDIYESYKSPVQRMKEINAKMDKAIQDAVKLPQKLHHEIKAHDIRQVKAYQTRVSSLNRVFGLQQELDALVKQHTTAALEAKSAQKEIDRDFQKDVEVRVLYGELSADETEKLREAAEKRWSERHKQDFINASKDSLIQSASITPEEAEARLSQAYQSPMEKAEGLSMLIKETYQKLKLALPAPGQTHNGDIKNKKISNMNLQSKGNQPLKRRRKQLTKSQQKHPEMEL
ncbi:MAG: hypothetical protein AAFY41_00495 [Bacteroidota bacterium]